MTTHDHDHTHLYVDTDDTLVLYGERGTHPYGVLNKLEWRLNTELVAAINVWAEANNAMVRLWSGGGANYARHVYELVKDRVPFEVESFQAKFHLAKHDSVCSETNVTGFVDDQPDWILGGLRNRGLTAGLESHIRIFEPYSFTESVAAGDLAI